MVALPIALWARKDRRRISQVHIRFDYAVANGRGTLCGRRIPDRAIQGTVKDMPVTCKKCLQQIAYNANAPSGHRGAAV